MSTSWRPTRRARQLIVAVALLALAAPTTGFAQGGDTSPFSPALPSGPSTPTTTAAPQVLSNTNTTGDTGLSGGAAIAIAIGAFVVLGGISFFIWRDARRRAPVRARRAAAGGPDGLGGGRAGSKAKGKPRKLSPAERRRRKRGRAR